ncbi:hypothetical protein A1O3_01821 [Capronia epimyces CBS 606.96]|uniref:Uncharacterized protein n=1 Tax=Capronia epimyces CBS 606.96 TaxID=1182542 RepID=W9Y7D7_9EURO|nr:uncharacterized protein A1O3_01821 [Capronia epimyces CBS 606.96]EXJ88757.1 hypothetical protein A1O3_01821 [Capronia epimyces CBS 606.96]
MLLPYSGTQKAALALLMADAVFGNPLATIHPCPGVDKLSLTPITVTSQYQPVSTCQPTTGCIKGKCSTTYPFVTFPWVSTVVPCGWDGTTSQTTTVTAVDQPVRVSEHLETLTTVTAAPTAAKRSWIDWLHKEAEHQDVTVYETVSRRAMVPFREAGPLCVPGWEGSGLCQKCHQQPDGSRYQLLDIVECRSGTSASGKKYKKCSEWYETLIERPAPTSTVTAVALCSSQGNIPGAGTYTWTFPQVAPPVTITAPAKTVTVTIQGQEVVSVTPRKVYAVPGQSWNAYVTKSFSGATTFNFNIEITKIIIVNIPYATQHGKSTRVPIPTGSSGDGWWPLPETDNNGNAYYGGGAGWVDWAVPGATTSAALGISSSSTTTAVDSPVMFTTSTTSAGADTGPIGGSATTSSSTMGQGVDDIGGSISSSSFSTAFLTSASSTTGGDTGPIGGSASTTSTSTSTSTSGGDTGPIGGSATTSTSTSGGDTGPIGGSATTSTSSGADVGPIGGSATTSTTSGADVGPIGGSATTSTTSGADVGPIGGSTTTSSTSSAEVGPIGGSTTATTSSTSGAEVGPIGGSTTSMGSSTSSAEVGPVGQSTTSSSTSSAEVGPIGGSTTTSGLATTTTATSPICNLNANVCLDSQLITANTVSTVTCPLLGGLICSVNDLLNLVPTLLGGNPNVLSVLVGGNQVVGLSITPEQVAAAINAGELNGLCGAVPPVTVLVNDPTCPINPTTGTTTSSLSSTLLGTSTTTTPLIVISVGSSSSAVSQGTTTLGLSLLSTTTGLGATTTSAISSAATTITSSVGTTIASSTTSAAATTSTSAGPICNLNANICLDSQLITANTVVTQNCPLGTGVLCTTNDLLSLVPALLGGNPSVASVLVENNQVLGLSITPAAVQAAINAGQLNTVCSALQTTTVTLYDPTCPNNPTTSSTTLSSLTTLATSTSPTSATVTTSVLLTTTSAATTTLTQATTTTSAVTSSTTTAAAQCGVAVTLCAGQTLADVGLSTVTCDTGVSGLLCSLTQALQSAANVCAGTCGVIGTSTVGGADVGLIGNTNIQAIQAAVGAVPNCQPGGDQVALSDPGCDGQVLRRAVYGRARRY